MGETTPSKPSPAVGRRDSRGRPVVAVTGLGIVTSLGQGKAANWEALTAGRSGIHAIERFLGDEALARSARRAGEFAVGRAFCGMARA